MPSQILANRIIVNTHDPDGLAAFYRNVLELDQVYHDDHEKWYVFKAGTIEIGIHSMPEQMDRKWQNKICFKVKDIKKEHSRLKGMGLLVSESIESYNNEWQFDVTDPLGNDYQFIQMIHTA